MEVDNGRLQAAVTFAQASQFISGREAGLKLFERQNRLLVWHVLWDKALRFHFGLVVVRLGGGRECFDTAELQLQLGLDAQEVHDLFDAAANLVDVLELLPARRIYLVGRFILECIYSV